MNPQCAPVQRVGNAWSPGSVEERENHETTSAEASTPVPGDLLLDRGDFQIRLARGARCGESDVLVQRLYSWRGYEMAQAPALSDRRPCITVQACHGAAVFGTLNVGLDSERGLASDVLYGREIDAFRRAGAVVSEFTRLAVDPEHGSKDVLGALFHLTQLIAVYTGATDMFIEVNPRHVGFYKRMLNFQPAGERKLCRRVNAPAILMHLAVSYMRSQIARYGGRRDEAQRSLYPYYCSQREEAQVLRQFGALRLDQWVSSSVRRPVGSELSVARW